MLRIRFGGAALIILSLGLVLFAFYLAIEKQYTTAGLVFGGSVAATMISSLGDRLLGGR